MYGDGEGDCLTYLFKYPCVCDADGMNLCSIVILIFDSYVTTIYLSTIS